MNLKPILKNNVNQPSYPQKKCLSLSRKLCKAISIGAVSLVIGLGACGGGDGGSEIITPPGVPMVPAFVSGLECRDEPIDEMSLGDIYDYDFEMSGELCGHQDSRALVRVNIPNTHRIELSSGQEYTSVSILNEDLEQIAQLDSNMLSVDIELPAGSFHIIARSVDLENHPFGLFTLNLQPRDTYEW